MADLSDDIRSFIQSGIDPVTFEEISDRRHSSRSSRHRTAARVASVVVLIAVAVPVVLAVAQARPTTHKPAALDKHTGLARHRVLAALDTTIASGSFDITFSQQPVTDPTGTTTTTTTPCSLPGGISTYSDGYSGGAAGDPVNGTSPPVTAVTGDLCGSTGADQGLAISGQGTIDTNPFAMVVETQVPGLGQITLPRRRDRRVGDRRG